MQVYRMYRGARDRFHQRDSATTRAYRGLGLAIVRHLVELHGGTVEAASPGEGRGTTFRVLLPACAGVKAGGPEDAATIGEGSAQFEQISTLDGVRALIVDDEADARELFANILEQYKVEVATVSSAAEARRILGRWRPHILISDIGMPDETGYDLIRELRRLTPEQGGSIPAVALTAYAHPDDGRRALAAGFQLYVSKPVEPEALALAVARLVGRHVRAPLTRSSR